MAVPSILLGCVARSAVKHIANLLTFGIGGDLLVDAWDLYQRHTRDETKRKAEIEALAQASAQEVRAVVHQLVQREGASLDPKDRQRLEDFLAQTPTAIRRSLRRPADPSGRTLAAGQRLAGPEDLRAFLPTAVPRFRAGDQPLPGVDWELEELLGVGGFGEVWKARNHRLAGMAPVALKFCTDPQARERLLTHEARIVAQVQQQGRHPGIVPLLHTYLSADPPCLEYEYVSGGDLTGLIRDWHAAGNVTPEKASRVVLQLAETVGFAHRLTPPIVHRDLKPANVLIQKQPNGSIRQRVADFGIGGLAAHQAVKQTKQGPGTTASGDVVAGSYTALYASPQQMAGEKADPRDDVYSLGVIWYQILTGDMNRGAPTGDAWRKRLKEQGMSEALLEVLVSSVEHERADRPADAAELAERIREALGASGVKSTPPVEARRDRTAPVRPRQEREREREAKPARRGPPVPLLAVGGLVAVLVLGLLVVVVSIYRGSAPKGDPVAQGPSSISTPPIPEPDNTPKRPPDPSPPPKGPAEGIAGLTVLRGHTGTVNALAVSADGRLAATGGTDNTVRVWDLVAKNERAKFPTKGPVQDLAFTEDAAQVYGIVNGEVLGWQLGAGPPREYRPLRMKGARFLTADARFALMESASKGPVKFLMLRDMQDRALGKPEQLNQDRGLCLASTVGGDRALLLTEKGQMLNFDLKSGQSSSLPLPAGVVSQPTAACFGYQPAGLALVGMADGTIHSLLLPKKSYIRKLATEHKAPIRSLDISRTTLWVISSAADRSLYLINHTGHLASSLGGGQDEVHHVRFCLDGKHIVTTGSDSNIRVRDLSKFMEGAMPLPKRGR